MFEAMVTKDRRTDPALAQRLFDEPYRFDFYQAVRLLERINPERQPVGRDGDPRRDVARFRTRATLNFPPSQIYKIRQQGETSDDTPPEMTVAFMGLTGPLGLLPQHFTELVAERARYGDTAVSEFFDIFNHRMISLFYRSWEKHRLAAAYERAGLDDITQYLFDTIGMGTKGLRGKLSIPDQAMLLYGGLIAQRPHSGGIVEAILSDYFSVPVNVEQFAGQWLDLEEENCSRLGATNNQLGVNSIAGRRFWDNQSKFSTALGPLTIDEFRAFLPAGSAFRPATELVRFLVGIEFDFDIKLVLKADQVPDCVLATGANATPMLGWTTWLKTRPFSKDDSQVVLATNNQDVFSRN
jgi:type VI secretion system protein ImpH